MGNPLALHIQLLSQRLEVVYSPKVIIGCHHMDGERTMPLPRIKRKGKKNQDKYIVKLVPA